MCWILIFVGPVSVGIIADTPVGYIARFNLMQIGQILQTLAVCRWEKIDPKLMDLYGQFDLVSCFIIFDLDTAASLPCPWDA